MQDCLSIHHRYIIIHDTFTVMVFLQICERISGRDVDEELLGSLGYTEFFPDLCFFVEAGEDHCPLSKRMESAGDAGCHWNTRT